MASRNKKTIAIDARPYSGSKKYFGIVLYTNSILKVLLAAGYEVTLLTNQKLNNVHDVVRQCQVEVFGSQNSLLWELKDLPKHLKAHHYDIYFAGTNRGIPWGKIAGTRKVLGFLDTIPYSLPKLYFPRYKFHFVRHDLLPQLVALFRADKIITISQSSVDDIKRIFKRKNVTFLPLIVSYAKPNKRISRKEQFVYIGGENPRKRVDNLLKAFASFLEINPGYKLVLIGEGYDVYDSLLNELDITHQVEKPGFVSEEDKYQIIASSQALVYPSMYEGYGLEIAEGILADTVVVADPGGASSEVGGGAVIYIDSTDSASILRGMTQSLELATRQKLAKERKVQLGKIYDASMPQQITDYFDHEVAAARGESRD